MLRKELQNMGIPVLSKKEEYILESSIQTEYYLPGR